VCGGGGGEASCFQKCHCAGTDFKNLFAYCMGRFNKKELALMAVVSRRIWPRRNSLVFEGTFAHPDSVLKDAVSAQVEYRRCNKQEQSLLLEGGIPPCNRHNQWTPPQNGVIKLNWDASINSKKGWNGLGMVARDSNGEVLGARSTTKEPMADPSTAEVMAALCAMQFCKEAGFFEVIFEGDAARVIKEINSTPPFLSKIGHFIECIHSEMSWFKYVVFSFIPRESNTAAHTLAKEPTRQKIEMNWIEDFPLSIRSIVTRVQHGP